MTWCHQKLNIANMQKAANHWLGEHDFSSFRDSDCQSKSSIRRVDTIKINCVGEFIIFEYNSKCFFASYDKKHDWSANYYRHG